ncbi:MAG TPA: DNA translocase FtsK [Anaerolineae bacterium]|nr:DNA translocase FtsK [Anaerolineae bacterium]
MQVQTPQLSPGAPATRPATSATAKRLELQADRIDNILSLHKIQARVTGGTVGPRWVRFQVIPAIGQKLNPIAALQEEFAAALQATTCRVARQGAAVALEIPRDDPQPVRLLPLYQQLIDHQSLAWPINRLQTTLAHRTPPTAIPPITAILGLAADGAPLLLRLPSPDVAHVLIAGTTGCGKTALAQTMALSLAMANPSTALRMVLIDHGRQAFHQFAGLRHLAIPPVTDNHQALNVLQGLVALLDKRTAKDDDNATTAPTTPPEANDPIDPATGNRATIVLFIDELADLLMLGGPAAVWALTRLTQRGRGAGIHIVAATQKPTAQILGPLVKANFPVRLVGQVTSTADAHTATGWAGTGAEKLTGRGDFLAVAQGLVIRFQAAHVTEAEIRHVISGMPHTQPQAEPLFQAPPTPVEVAASPDPDQVLADQLRRSNLWPNRHDPDRTGYRWGFISEVCQQLFGRPAEGTWYQTAQRVIAKAETQEQPSA